MVNFNVNNFFFVKVRTYMFQLRYGKKIKVAVFFKICRQLQTYVFIIVFEKT